MTNTFSLNPFSFRAGVLRRGELKMKDFTESQSLFIQGWGTTLSVADLLASGGSQSLFIQGWGTTLASRRQRKGRLVSIPFHSGLGYYLVQNR